MSSRTQKSAFDDVITALLDPVNPFPAKLLHRFSDIKPEDLDSLKKIWLNVDSTRRVNLMEDLEEINDSDTLVSFEDLARFTIKDPDARVRCASIRMLWDTGDTALAHDLIQITKHDDSEAARAAAASGLGYYIYLGEIDEINDMLLDKVLNHLMVLLTSKDSLLVRRRALEALSYHTNEEIDDHIRSAYHSGESDWVVSALYAMGRSANPKWERMVLEMIASPNPEIRAEAVRAAGELELSAAREPLLILLEEPEALEEEVFYNAVWSLSKIGGQGVRKRLEDIIANSDEETAEELEDVLDNLDFTETVHGKMFEFELEGISDAEGLIEFDLDPTDGAADDGDEEAGRKHNPNRKPKRKA